MYYLDARASENKTMGSTIPKYFEYDWRHPRAQFYLDVQVLKETIMQQIVYIRTRR